MRRLWWACGVLVAAMGASGCVGESCTLIGCMEQAAVTLSTSTGEWQLGSYELTLTYANGPHRCQFTVTEPVDGASGISPVECTPALDVSFSQRQTCVPLETGNGVTCTRVPRQFDLTVTIRGTPAEAHVQLHRDTVAIVDEPLVFNYTSTMPNGPECGPTCRQARLTVQVR